MTAVEHDIFSPAATVRARVAELPLDWRAVRPDVLLGPPGAFLLSIAHYPQARVCVRDTAFLVDGADRPDIAQARTAVRWLGASLAHALEMTVPVHGVIVVVGAEGGFAVKEQPRDGVVKVLACKTLTMYLHSLPRTLDAIARDRIADAVAALPG